MLARTRRSSACSPSACAAAIRVTIPTQASAMTRGPPDRRSDNDTAGVAAPSAEAIGRQEVGSAIADAGGACIEGVVVPARPGSACTPHRSVSVPALALRKFSERMPIFAQIEQSPAEVAQTNPKPGRCCPKSGRSRSNLAEVDPTSRKLGTTRRCKSANVAHTRPTLGSVWLILADFSQILEQNAQCGCHNRECTWMGGGGAGWSRTSSPSAGAPGDLGLPLDARVQGG